MAEIILSVIIFGVLVMAMAVGVLMGRKPIAGSCGGVGAALGEDNYTCDICGDDPNKCEEQGSVDAQTYNAMDTQQRSF